MGFPAKSDLPGFLRASFFSVVRAVMATAVFRFTVFHIIIFTGEFKKIIFRGLRTGDFGGFYFSRSEICRGAQHLVLDKKER
jgi:hypothetical protein